VLLEEIIQYNDEGNFDRIVAAELAIALAMKLDPLLGAIGGTGDSRINSLYNPIKKSKSVFSGTKTMFKTKQIKLF
jgi:hypothetical protein